MLHIKTLSIFSPVNNVESLKSTATATATRNMDKNLLPKTSLNDAGVLWDRNPAIILCIIMPTPRIIDNICR